MEPRLCRPERSAPWRLRQRTPFPVSAALARFRARAGRGQGLTDSRHSAGAIVLRVEAAGSVRPSAGPARPLRRISNARVARASPVRVSTSPTVSRRGGCPRGPGSCPARRAAAGRSRNHFVSVPPGSSLLSAAAADGRAPPWPRRVCDSRPLRAAPRLRPGSRRPAESERGAPCRLLAGCETPLGAVARWAEPRDGGLPVTPGPQGAEGAAAAPGAGISVRLGRC